MTTNNEAFLRKMRLNQIDTNTSTRKPPEWILDKQADDKLTGRFNVKPSNICDLCHQARSVNGSCGC